MRCPVFVIDEERPWLGGYIEGGDEATHFPELYEWLVHDYGVRSMIDVGCGEGWAMRYFRRMGCTVRGFDGIAQDDPDIVEHDFTKRSAEMGMPFDLAWCCEFVEHIEQQFIPNFMALLACADLVLMTHAEPGQAGHHHVNCQPADYWIAQFAAIGYDHNEHLTTQTRVISETNESPWNHYARSGMAFTRAEGSAKIPA